MTPRQRPHRILGADPTRSRHRIIAALLRLARRRGLPLTTADRIARERTGGAR